jgi:hypothetical protein
VSTELHLWLWTITDEITGKRRQTRYRMTEEQARERFGDDAQKVEGSLEIRSVQGQSTSGWLTSPPKSKQGGS